ncbi:MAG: potassium channel family protein [Bacteroidetes bacterium]|nr:potassium channel family protein [Bacteroidota bacterium]
MSAADTIPSDQAPRSLYHRIRLWVYNLLLSHDVHTPTVHLLHCLEAALIALNVIAIVLETVQEIDAVLHGLFYWFEVVSVVIFSAEYLARLWATVENEKYWHPLYGRIRYAFTFFALVDLLAIVPFFMHGFGAFDLRFIRGLRLMRLLRVLKLGRYSESLSLFVKVWHAKRDDIMVSLFVILLMLLLSSSLMYFLEHDAQPKAFPSIPAALWWGVATLTTVGYGDIYPVTPVGKVCSSIIALLSIGLVALPSGVIAAAFVEELHAKRKPPSCPHCGQEIVH